MVRTLGAEVLVEPERDDVSADNLIAESYVIRGSGFWTVTGVPLRVKVMEFTGAGVAGGGAGWAWPEA